MLQVRSWLPWFKRVAKGRILFVSHQLTLWVYMCVCLTVTGGRLKVRFCVELHIDVVVGVWCEFIGIYAVVSISQIGIWFACQKEVRLAVFVSCGLHEFVQSHSLIILSTFMMWCGASLERWIRDVQVASATGALMSSRLTSYHSLTKRLRDVHLLLHLPCDFCISKSALVCFSFERQDHSCSFDNHWQVCFSDQHSPNRTY